MLWRTTLRLDQTTADGVYAIRSGGIMRQSLPNCAHRCQPYAELTGRPDFNLTRYKPSKSTA